MFRPLQDLMDASVVATDGMMGKVRNFFFDDQSWNVRYLVVDVGGWSGRKVVIALSVVDRADFKKKAVSVRLTREQVRHSPDVAHFAVKAGDWLDCRSLVISTQSVESISWGKHQVIVGPNTSFIRTAAKSHRAAR